MVEIVFDDSACGCLKLAQHAGRGCIGSSAGVIVSSSSGGQPPAAEIRKAKQEAERRMQEEHARAVPLGGEPSDVYSLPLALSTGRLSDGVFGEQRAAFLDRLMKLRGAYGNDAADVLQKARRNLDAVLARAARGEPLRIWSDSTPDSRCAVCWLFAQLDEAPHGGIHLMELPSWEERPDGTVEEKSGWGEIAPGDCAAYLPLCRRVPDALIRAGAAHWRALAGEDAPLRAVVNGRLCSVPEDFYDGFLLRELDSQPEDFSEAALIAQIMIRFRLGVPDVWIAHRVDEMIRTGRLAVVSQAPEGHPAYKRILRKIRSGR